MGSVVRVGEGDRVKLSRKVRPYGMFTNAQVGWVLACLHPWKLGMMAARIRGPGKPPAIL